MNQYVVFLRGINVGGHNLLKMQDVRQIFTLLGFENVTSYKASGNILFESNLKPTEIVRIIKQKFQAELGRELVLFLRTSSKIKDLIKHDPFKERTADPSKLYVTFIPEEAPTGIDLPLWSKNKDVEVFFVSEGEAFSQTFLHKGRYGAPNNLIEKMFNLPATTRNWNTLQGIYDKFIRDY